MNVFDHYEAMDRKLVSAGFPPTSPWWRATLREFYDTGRRQLVLRVGRRGGKSSTLSRVAVLEALAGDHRIPPGDIGLVSFISVNRDEAAKRLRTIEAILRALDVLFVPLRDGQGIELRDRPIAFQVMTASIDGVVGGTVIAAVGDEVAIWHDKESGSNPATEVLAALRPTMATQPNAKIFLSSSPLSTLDAHHKAFDAGDNDFQSVTSAPTWVANDTLTESDCRALEPDDHLFDRNFRAIPRPSKSAAFEESAIDAAMALEIPAGAHTAYVPGEAAIFTDQSSGRNDDWPWAAAQWFTDVLVVHEIESVDGSFWQRVKADEVISRIARTAAAFATSKVFGDQREGFALESEFRKAELQFVTLTWTNETKVAAVEKLRSLLRDRKIKLPKDEKLKRELLSFEERYTPSGALTYGGRRSGDDRVAMLLTLCTAVAAGMLGRGRKGGEQAPTCTFVNDSRWTVQDPWSKDFGKVSRGFG